MERSFFFTLFIYMEGDPNEMKKYDGLYTFQAPDGSWRMLLSQARQDRHLHHTLLRDSPITRTMISRTSPPTRKRKMYVETYYSEYPDYLVNMPGNARERLLSMYGGENALLQYLWRKSKKSKKRSKSKSRKSKKRKRSRSTRKSKRKSRRRRRRRRN